jgi:hypothetical protein
MFNISLHKFINEHISKNIQAYFHDENLIIEGYDIGKSINEWWGDNDYEYSTTFLEK